MTFEHRDAQIVSAYVVYDTQDSSWYRDGLSEDEARSLCDERNRENSRSGNRYAVVAASEFDKIAKGDAE